MNLSRDVLAMNLYAVLGVPRTATVAQIRRAYRLQAITSHPDLHGTPAERRMVELNIAAFVLLDPGRRAEYDRRRPRRTATPSPARQAAAPFYPWAEPRPPVAEEWVSPSVSPRPDRTDKDVLVLLHGVRQGPSRALGPVLEYAESCSPGTHLLVTCASVCLALLLIAAARPKSLIPDEHPKAIACVQRLGDGG